MKIITDEEITAIIDEFKTDWSGDKNLTALGMLTTMNLALLIEIRDMLKAQRVGNWPGVSGGVPPSPQRKD